jgi:type IV pilus assembly protein PilM
MKRPLSILASLAGLRPAPIGIAISKRLVRVLQGRGERLDAGLSAAVAPIEGLDPAGIAETIRELVERGPFRGRRCVLTLPRRMVAVQAMRMPALGDEDLRAAIRWEAPERFGVERERAQVDFLRTGLVTEGRDEVLAMCGDRPAVEALLDPLVDAGLRPEAAEPSFVAAARACSRTCRRDADRGRIRAAVEIDADGATILVLQGSRLAFARGVAFGGDAFEAAIARSLGIGADEAASLRRDRMAAASAARSGRTDARPVDPEADAAASDATRGLRAELAHEVARCLRYYGVTFRGPAATEVRLCGEDALEPGLESSIAEVTQLPVTDDDPDAGLRLMFGNCTRQVHDERGHVAWYPSFGAAMRPSRGASARREAA